MEFDTALQEHSAHIDALQLDLAAEALTRAAQSLTASSITHLSSARLLAAEGLQLYAQAVHGVAGDTPDTQILKRANYVASKAASLLAPIIDADRSAASLEARLVELSALLVCAQSLGAVDSTSSEARSLLHYSLNRCEEYTAIFDTSALAVAAWRDPWSPFIRVLFAWALEKQVVDAEFTDVVVRVKGVARAKADAGSGTDALLYLDALLMECLVYQNALIYSKGKFVYAQMVARAQEGLAYITQITSSLQPAEAILRVREELQEILDSAPMFDVEL